MTWGAGVGAMTTGPLWRWRPGSGTFCTWKGSGLPMLFEALNGWVATTNGVVVRGGWTLARAADVATNGTGAENVSPATAGAVTSRSPSTASTPWRIILLASTRTVRRLFTLMSEFCSARRPTSTRPTGHSPDPTDGIRRRPSAPGGRALRAGWHRRD